MKSVIFSAGLIIIVIITLVCFSVYTAESSKILAEISSHFYETDSIDENLKIYSEFKEEWNKRKTVLACFTSHQNEEKTDEILAELKVYISQNQKTDALATIEKLNLNISSMTEGDAITLKNIL